MKLVKLMKLFSALVIITCVILPGAAFAEQKNIYIKVMADAFPTGKSANIALWANPCNKNVALGYHTVDKNWAQDFTIPSCGGTWKIYLYSKNVKRLHVEQVVVEDGDTVHLPASLVLD